MRYRLWQDWSRTRPAFIPELTAADAARLAARGVSAVRLLDNTEIRYHSPDGRWAERLAALAPEAAANPYGLLAVNVEPRKANPDAPPFTLEDKAKIVAAACGHAGLVLFFNAPGLEWIFSGAARPSIASPAFYETMLGKTAQVRKKASAAAIAAESMPVVPVINASDGVADAALRAQDEMVNTEVRARCPATRAAVWANVLHASQSAAERAAALDRLAARAEMIE